MNRGIATVLALVISTVIFLTVYIYNTTIPNFNFAYGKLRNVIPTMGAIYESIPRIDRNGSLAIAGKFGAPPEPWVREYYAKFAPERAASLNRKNLGNPVLFSAIVPEVFCPNLVRVGSVLDGGKYVCNPRLIPANCSIYSLGIDNEISFDKAIQEFNNFTCKIYGYDKATTNNGTLSEYEKINGKIEKLELASKTNVSANKYFLGDLVQRNNDTFIEILKMDVEGQEHDSLVPFLQKYDVCQVLVEIHGTAESHVSLLRSIAKLNYALFSNEVNGYTPTVCEHSFINLNCMEKYGAYMLGRYLNKIQK